eukprot:TRINITY_DN644_c0_g1_i1.p2 TRINITY_DN644_c0_g1~~TRINITY_DN644_c0_g1_i1.p2  ORF type:complete len:469 (+),score=15.56 TRINITY_DN644_c0_g1_i1:1707-3113(+)
MSPPVNLSAMLPYKWRVCETPEWRPETREGGTLTVLKVHHELRAYLFGGLSRDLHSSIVYLTADTSKHTFKWTMDSLGDQTKKRYGHTATVWEDQLVIMGGSRMFSNESKQRECLSDVLVFNPDREEWTEIVPEGLPCEPRRYHCSCMVGSQLLVHGGINGKQSYLSDLIVLNLGKHDKRAEFGKSCRWIAAYTKGHKPGNLANHTCQLILHPDRYKVPSLISLSSLPDTRGTGKPKVVFRTQIQQIEYEGVYFFGGRDERGPKNKLYILKIGQKPCEWIEPSVEGRPPIARYGHSMNYCPEKNVITIFGGRNDDNYINTGQAYLNDVWVLTLDKLRWIQWDKEDCGIPPEPRYSHCAATIGSSIVIFGGLGEENYCKADIYSLEMEELPIKFRDKIGKRSSMTNVRAIPLPVRSMGLFEEAKGFSGKLRIAFGSEGVEEDIQGVTNMKCADSQSSHLQYYIKGELYV